MTLLESVLEGREGKNSGYILGSKKLTEDITGLSSHRNIIIGGESKSGKTSFLDDQFICSVLINNPNPNVKYLYYSFEISRIQKEAKFTSYFIEHDYGIVLSTNYLLGRAKDANGKRIIISDNHLDMVKKVYQKWIIKIFGEYDSNNKRIKDGFVDLIEHKCDSDEIEKNLQTLALKYGKFTYETYEDTVNGIKVNKKRINGYIPNEGSPLVVVILDHCRLTKRKQGKSLKDTMDETNIIMTDYSRVCGFSCITLVHINRSISDLERIKYQKENLSPDISDVKDSGSLSENATDVILLFNPCLDIYRLKKHFEIDLAQFDNNYRSVHLVVSRFSEAPLNYAFNFNGVIGKFTDYNTSKIAA